MKKTLAVGLMVATLIVAAPSGGISANKPKPAKPKPQPYMHVGSRGPNVAQLQLMLSGGKPSVYRSTKTFPRIAKRGIYGVRTANAVYNMKKRLGWPDWSLQRSGKVAGPYFIAILKGKRLRPLYYIQIAAKRVSAPVATESKCDLRIRKAALELLAKNVVEYPFGSNRDGSILRAIQATTGAYGAAWCMSTVQYLLIQAGLSPIANRSAGVFYTVDWARHRGGLVRARPKVGSFAAFMNALGHIGTVVAVTAHGYVTVEGNTSNAVKERFHTIGDRPTVFIWPPHPKGGCK